MTTVSRISGADRIKAAVIAVATVAAVGFLLVYALGYQAVRAASEDLKTFNVALSPPPPREPPPPPPEHQAARTEAAAAPMNLRAKATPVVAPTPIVPPLAPSPPVIAASIAEQGPAPSAGAADRPGPGTGAGGAGDGFGGGGRGDGDGGGGSFERETPPRKVGGRLSIRDLPPDLADAGGGTVGVRYIVEADGRVSSCRVTNSSGLPELDDLTCRLIRERFRYRPSLDADRRPVPVTVIENHSWVARYDDQRP